MPSCTQDSDSHSFSERYITVQQGKTFYLTSLPARVLVKISYAAVRGKSQEQGAVQRILDGKRVVSLKDYYLKGGDFSACVILNWASTDNHLRLESDSLSFTIAANSAQLVDGQHRVEGLREAIKVKQNIADKPIPVAIYIGLDTTACADIFLSINDKQKPVPRSLVTDLFGVASDLVVDPIAERARDIAGLLNEEEDSPYHSLIRFANEPRSKFGINVSTVVDNIKSLIEPQGILSQVGLVELNMQKSCIFNYFNMLKAWYGRHWDEKSNVFLRAAGFVGAVDFLRLSMIPYCNLSGDFTTHHMTAAMRLDSTARIDDAETKGLQGRAAWNRVNELLKNRFATEGADRRIKL